MFLICFSRILDKSVDRDPLILVRLQNHVVLVCKCFKVSSNPVRVIIAPPPDPASQLCTLLNWYTRRTSASLCIETRNLFSNTGIARKRYSALQLPHSPHAPVAARTRNVPWILQRAVFSFALWLSHELVRGSWTATSAHCAAMPAATG